MDIILPVVLFVVGFVAGGFLIWQLKHKESEAAKRSATELEDLFGNLSRQALS